ncbi:MAG: ferrous iron transport protein B [Oscillospiraceae bacterium]|nr:ferrous iron transport protein B [Oscillospiraceae bacterium]
MTIGFIGNPNCGKTTLFNAYTGAHLKVANWPGVTVEKKEGAMKYHNETYKLVDLPGTYSLTSYTMEEIVTRNYILSGEVDVLINVVDASSLERNLYLTLQLIELGKPVVVALNMMDIVEKRGMEIDLHRLPEMLGIPVIPVSAIKRTGIDILIHAASHHAKTSQSHHFEMAHVSADISKHREFPFVYSREIENKIAVISKELGQKYPDIKNYRWYAIKLLEKDEELTKYHSVSEELINRSYETDIINQKYEFIETVIEEILVNKEKSKAFTDKIDTALTNKFTGLPIFLLIMGFIFFLTFLIGGWLKGYFEIIIENFSGFIDSGLTALKINEMVHSLIIDGIIAGVGGILTFLPNIFILFLALAFLEDSGYMSRVAYVMDGIMGKAGLSGKAFIPMLLGFGCSVPAVMAARSLESMKDRLRVMLVIPFMSCSAKLPIYVLFAGMFFPDNPALVAFSMYIIGLAAGLLSALIIHRFDKTKEENMLLIELPEYKSPSARTIFIYVWDKIKDYLSRAGTVIFAASVIVWIVMNFGFSGYTKDISESFGAVLGKYLMPVLAPAGLGFWQAGVALIAGFAAKEIVVASFAILFGIAGVMSESGMNLLAAELGNIGFGPLNAYCLMLFALLYPPCVAALGAIKRESGSWKRLGLIMVFQIGVAWTVSFAVYQIGRLF